MTETRGGSPTQAELATLDRLRGEAEERLRPVCADWPAEDFRRLVDEVAEFRYRHDTTFRD